MTQNATLLLVEDDERARYDLQVIFNFLGENVIATTSDRWRSKVDGDASLRHGIKVAIVGADTQLDRIDLLREIHRWDGGLPFMLLGRPDLAGLPDEGLRQNIIARLPYPLSYQPLLDALHKAQVFREHYHRVRDLGGVRDYNMFRSLVGQSAQIQRIRQMMGQVAAKEVTVLITGESGTGKEVVARNLHLNSSRADKPFIPINCGAIPRELLESELFGHEKGAFTGAVVARAGRFELADGGTLFLDEIGDMPLPMQVKLLRVLQERSFERVGGVKTLQTDVRILAATHRDLEALIETGEFRQDLYYRINVFPIEMPSLRERPEDIPLLLNELISIMEAEKRGSVRFNSSAIGALCRYDWPGNVRELANLVERMAILHPNGIIGINDLPRKFQAADPGSDRQSQDSPSSASAPPATDPGSSAVLPLDGLDLKEYLANLEKNLIEQALDDSAGVVARAADRLNIRRTTLVEKIRKYSLQRNSTDSEDQQLDADTDADPPAADQAASG
ncbi:MAG: hypothetical protein RLZZ385_1881 [Pseudomonadota bacterium]